MEAFRQNAGSSMAGTVVEDEDRTTAGASIADKSLWMIDDGTLGRLGSPGDEDDSPERTTHESQDMEIEFPEVGLEKMNNTNRADQGGSNGGDEGSGLQPTQLDLGDVSDAGGGRFVFRKWHAGTMKNALGGTDNGYTIIGNFDEFRQENNRDESHGRGYIARMIEDFGGEATRMRATADTNYVVVGQPPEGRVEREHYDLQLKEADTLKLPLVSVDELMRQIDRRETNIKGPYKTSF